MTFDIRKFLTENKITAASQQNIQERMIPLKSVGAIIDTQSQLVYAMNADGSMDSNNSTPAEDIDVYDWWDQLDNKDRQTIKDLTGMDHPGGGEEALDEFFDFDPRGQAHGEQRMNERTPTDFRFFRNGNDVTDEFYKNIKDSPTQIRKKILNYLIQAYRNRYRNAKRANIQPEEESASIYVFLQPKFRLGNELYDIYTMSNSNNYYKRYAFFVKNNGTVRGNLPNGNDYGYISTIYDTNDDNQTLWNKTANNMAGNGTDQRLTPDPIITDIRQVKYIAADGSISANPEAAVEMVSDHVEVNQVEQEDTSAKAQDAVDQKQQAKASAAQQAKDAEKAKMAAQMASIFGKVKKENKLSLTSILQELEKELAEKKEAKPALNQYAGKRAEQVAQGAYDGRFKNKVIPDKKKQADKDWARR